MTERFCLRCDWTGETDEAGCPRCGAPLYRLEPADPGREPAPAPSRSEAPVEVPRPRLDPNEEVPDTRVLPAATSGERGRWRVIALALTLTAVVAIALTRGGEAAPGGERGSRDEPRAASAGPSAVTQTTSAPVVSTCNGGPAPPDLAEPADSVPAATADYLFQDSLGSSIGTAPALVEIEEGSSVVSVDGTTGTTVLRFAGGRGLALTPTSGVVGDAEYTIEVLFRFDFVSEVRKVIDFKDGSADGGLYVVDGCLAFVPAERDAVTSIAPNAFVQVVLTRAAGGPVVGYVDGVRQFAFEDRRGLATVGRTETLRFFADDHTTTGEYSGGAVSQIRLFDQALTENEVAALACSELAIADATFACREIHR